MLKVVHEESETNENRFEWAVMHAFASRATRTAPTGDSNITGSLASS
jgi:hypothetical protein